MRPVVVVAAHETSGGGGGGGSSKYPLVYVGMYVVNYIFRLCSYDALLVGAPMYTELDNGIMPEVGRLYVYFNTRTVCVLCRMRYISQT